MDSVQRAVLFTCSVSTGGLLSHSVYSVNTSNANVGFTSQMIYSYRRSWNETTQLQKSYCVCLACLEPRERLILWSLRMSLMYIIIPGGCGPSFLLVGERSQPSDFTHQDVASRYLSLLWMWSMWQSKWIPQINQGQDYWSETSQQQSKIKTSLKQRLKQISSEPCTH